MSSLTNANFFVNQMSDNQGANQKKKRRVTCALLGLFILLMGGSLAWDRYWKNHDRNLARSLEGSGLEVEHRSGTLSITASPSTLPRTRRPDARDRYRDRFRSKGDAAEQQALARESAASAALSKGSQFHQLRSLNLTGDAFSNASMPLVAALGRDKKISSIGLFRTRVSDAGLLELESLRLASVLLGRNDAITKAGMARMADWTSLRNVSLYDGSLTDADLESLHGLTQLKTVNLIGKTVSTRAVDRLRSALPECEVKVHVSEVLETQPSTGEPSSSIDSTKEKGKKWL